MTLRVPLLVFLYFTSLSHRTFAEIEHVTVMGPALLGESMAENSSTSSLTADDFTRAPNPQFESMLNFIPNVTGAGGTPRFRFFQIRGVGERSAYEGMPNSSVAISLDDIDYSGFGNVTSLVGVSSLNVYRGPQMTAQGINGIGGIVELRSKRSEGFVSGEVLGSYSSFDTQRQSVWFSGPVGSNLGYSLSYNREKSDGYIKNTYMADEETNSRDDQSLKGQLNWRIGQTNLTLNHHHFIYHDGYDAFDHDNARTVESDHPGSDNTQINAGSLVLEHDFGSVLSTSTLSYLKANAEYSYDEDWGNNDYWNTVPGYNANYNYWIKFPRNLERKSLDQRFYFNGSSSDAHIGVYLRRDDEAKSEIGYKNDAIRKDLRSIVKMKQYALYGEYSYSLSQADRLKFGSRVERRHSSYSDNNGILISPDETLWGANLTYENNFSKETSVFIKASRGYKAGGVNTQASLPVSRKEFKNEKLYLLELGGKYKRDDLELKTSLFGMYRDDVQVKTSAQDDPSDPSSYTYYQDNATDAIVYGLEFEGKIAFSDSLMTQMSFGLMHSEYGDYQYGARKLKGRELSYSPEYQINVGVTYRPIESLFLNMNTYLQDDYYFANSHDYKGRSYQLVDVNIGNDFSWGQVKFWCQNIFNERVETRGYFFSNEPPAWEDKLYVQLAPPRTLGVDISIPF